MDYFKIKVESEDHSKEIQEWLFSKGVHWWPKSESRVVEGLREIYYGVDPWYISGNTGDCGYFDEIPIPEKWFYDGKLQDIPREVPKEALMEPLTGDTFQELMRAQLDGKTLQMDVLGVGWEDCAYTLDPVRVEDINKPVKWCRVKPEPRYCNGTELDECIKEPLEKGDKYFIANPAIDDYRDVLFWYGDSYDFRCLGRGVAYLDEDSAIKHAKAMLNILN